LFTTAGSSVVEQATHDPKFKGLNSSSL